jgi:hypothetical protein
MSFDRRKLLAAALGGGAADHRLHDQTIAPANADGTYCYRIAQLPPQPTCTPGPVPSAQVESQALDFGGSADRLTVYLVRALGRYGHVISVSTQGGPSANRARELCAPAVGARTACTDRHMARRDGRPRDFGKAGEVLVVEVIRQVWAWGSKYRLEPGTIDDAANARATSDWLRTLVEDACDLVTQRLPVPEQHGPANSSMRLDWPIPSSRWR